MGCCWHQKCFLCYGCKKPFPSKSFKSFKLFLSLKLLIVFYLYFYEAYFFLSQISSVILIYPTEILAYENLFLKIIEESIFHSMIENIVTTEMKLYNYIRITSHSITEKIISVFHY